MQIMVTLQELANRLGLSYWQTQRLVAELRAPLGDMCKGVQGRPLFIAPEAIAMIERAMMLYKEGTPLRELANVVKSEMHGTEKISSNEHNTFVQPAANGSQELVKTLQNQIDDLRRERDRLLGLIDNGQAQIKELQGQVRDLERLALPSHSSQNSSNGQGERLSRWQALRMLVLGR